MAAFMQRMGSAINIGPDSLEAQFGGVAIDSSPVVCVTPPRSDLQPDSVVAVTAVLELISAADVDMAAQIVVNDGNGWFPLGVPVRVSIVTGHPGVIPLIGDKNFLLTTGVVQYGVQLIRDGLPGTGNPSAGHCRIRLDYH